MNNHPKKHHLRIHLREIEEGLVYEVREVFFGFKTLLALFGFSVGAILAGRSIWEYSMKHFGLHWTTIIGILIFVVSGRILKKFKS